MAGQIQSDKQPKVYPILQGHALPEVAAFASVTVEKIVDAGESLEVCGGGQKENTVLGAVFLQKPGHVQESGDATGVLRTGGHARDHRHGVVVGFHHNQMIFPSSSIPSLTGWHPFVRSGEHPIDVLRFHGLPVHPGVEGDATIAGCSRVEELVGMCLVHPVSGDVRRDG